jgi:hypothetical protein
MLALLDFSRYTDRRHGIQGLPFIERTALMAVLG